MVSFYLSILALVASVHGAVYGPRALAAGSAACANLTSILGSKVENNHLAPDYLESQIEYWNARQSQYSPSCVLYPKTAQDVSIGLQAIKTAGSRFAVKGGGHNPNTFFSSVDAGVLIDLSQMQDRSYDPKTQYATYGPGGTFGDTYNYFIQFNRTVVGARLAGVGLGLGLGGGLSYLSGQYGLAVDSFRELEVVLPSGKIVNASPTQNKDLWFAMKGGGGNAYGIVTKYTVQSRPAGDFTAGNMIYALESNNDVLGAIHDFAKYNTDPKAAIIGTYEALTTPGEIIPGGPKLDQAILLFVVYDGPDPGHVFDNFTKLNPLLNTVSSGKNYIEVVNLPFPGTTELSRADNVFRVAVHNLDDQGYLNHYNAWYKWCQANKGSYILSSIDYQPIAKSLTDASAAQGGNAMQMPEGPWIWLNFLINTNPLLTDAQYSAVQASFRDMVNSVPNAKGLPLFINDANYDQNPLKTFSTYSKLQSIKKKYDPDQFFAKYTGGWNFNA